MTLTLEMRNKYRQQLTELRTEIRSRILQARDAIPEETHPVGEHEIAAGEGGDAVITREHSDQDLLRSVEESLARIDQGEFGICRDCGRPIPARRLKVVPYAAYCIGCERAHEQQ